MTETARDARALIAALHLERAPSDTARALVLDALIAYSQAVGLSDLHDAAKAARPHADPFHPPDAWREAYIGVFRRVADPEWGVYPEEADRYCFEYWSGLDDAQRHERLGAPGLGEEDGRKDAEELNRA